MIKYAILYVVFICYLFIIYLLYMSIKNKLYEFQNRLFDIFIIISWSTIIISALGYSNLEPLFLNTLDYYVRIYICLFLIWRFNPLRGSYEFTDLDRKIAFSAGLFILTTTALNQYIKSSEKVIKNLVKKE